MRHRSDANRAERRPRRRFQCNQGARLGVHAPDRSAANNGWSSGGTALPAGRQRTVGPDLDFAEGTAAGNVDSAAALRGAPESKADRCRRDLPADAAEGSLIQDETYRLSRMAESKRPATWLKHWRLGLKQS